MTPTPRLSLYSSTWVLGGVLWTFRQPRDRLYAPPYLLLGQYLPRSTQEGRCIILHSSWVLVRVGVFSEYI
jgi:hypothetical protein